MTFILIALGFLLLVGFFSGIEVGLISLLPPRVQHGVRVGHHGAWILAFFMRHPGYLLATTLVGSNLCLVVASNCAMHAITTLGLTGPGWSLLLTATMAVMLLTVEIVPKDWFRQYPYERCRRFAYPLYAAFWALSLPVVLCSRFAGLVNRLVGGQMADDDTARTMLREDFRIMLRESEKDGFLDAAAVDLLDRSLDFHHLQVQDIYRARAEVVQLSAEVTLADAVARCREHHLSRLPVHSGPTPGSGPWCGVFSLYDALFTIPEQDWVTTRVVEVLRPVPTIACDRLMAEVLVKAKHSHATLLVVTTPGHSDQHLGIVTATDVVKVLFGHDPLTMPG